MLTVISVLSYENAIILKFSTMKKVDILILVINKLCEMRVKSLLSTLDCLLCNCLHVLPCFLSLVLRPHPPFNVARKKVGKGLRTRLVFSSKVDACALDKWA